MASTTTATTATDAAAPAAFTKKTALEPEEVALHRIRITLSSVNVKNLEKGERKNKKIDDEEKKKILFFAAAAPADTRAGDDRAVRQHRGVVGARAGRRAAPRDAFCCRKKKKEKN